MNNPALDKALAEYAVLKANKASFEAEIDAREALIRQFYQRMGNRSAWLSTPRFRFKNSSVPGRKILDSAQLRAELTDRIGEMETDALIARATTEGNPYERLTVTPIKSSLYKEALP